MTHRVYFYTVPSYGGMLDVSAPGYSHLFSNGEYADLAAGHYNIRPITTGLPPGSYYHHWTTSGGVTVSGNWPCPTPGETCDLNVTGDGSITAYWVTPLSYRITNNRTGVSVQVEPGQTANISMLVGDLWNVDVWGATPNGTVELQHWDGNHTFWHAWTHLTADGSGHASATNLRFGEGHVWPIQTRALNETLGNVSGIIIFVPDAGFQHTITVNTSPGGLDSPSGGGTYDHGTEITISVSAVPGYTFLHWLRDGLIYSYSLSFLYIVDTSRTFTAVFQAAPPQYPITVITSPPDLDAPYGGGSYEIGQTAYIGVSSFGGYTFQYWTRDFTFYTYAQTFSYVVDGARTFRAVFQAIPQYTIAVNTSPGGLDSPYGGGTYPVGTWISIGVSPVTGYTFLQWNRDGAFYTSNLSFNYEVDAAHTFTAVFQAIPQYTITVNTSPGGLDAPSGAGTYYQGTDITISVSPVVGKTFQYWNRDGSFYTYNQSFGYNVEAAHTFTAVFTVTQCVITVNTSPGGLDAPTGAGTYPYGTNISIGVSNVAHYNFAQWNRDGAFYTFSQTFGYFVDASHTFTAVFRPIEHAIDAALKKLGITKTVGADATFVMRFDETYNIDAALEGPAASPTRIDAVLKAVNLKVLTKLKDVRLRSALGIAKDVYLYPAVYVPGYGIGVSLRQWFGIRKLFATDIALEQIDLSAGHGINVRIATLSGRSKDVDIDVALKELSLSELHEIDVALEKFGLINYHSDAVLVLRSRVSLAIDAAIARVSSASYGTDTVIRSVSNIPAFFSVGAYLTHPQKFDLTVSFEQFEANPSFESLSVVSSFETLEVTPYFQEV